MTTIAPTNSWDVDSAQEGVTVDSLDIRTAVIGDGLMLTHDDQDRWVVHTVGRDGRAELLGKFDDPATALSRLDALES